jgi:type VI secretion system protein ImpC
LLRLPYGADTDPIELLDFEEMPAEPVHEHYLWGNPSVACAYLLAEAFGDQGWDLIPGSFQDIEGLPLHLHKHEGESRVKPCAEALLTMRAIEAILDDGFMPLVSYRASDTVRLARFQSVADPSTHRDTNLAGWWS